MDAVSKSRIVLFTPSIYDETIEGCEKKNHVGVNMALGRCGEFIKKIAPEYNAKVVDLWTCMNEVNSALQKDNPKDTIVGKDRVHPGDLGGFVMAYEFIRTLEEPSPVSEL